MPKESHTSAYITIYTLLSKRKKNLYILDDINYNDHQFLVKFIKILVCVKFHSGKIKQIAYKLMTR